MCDRQPLYEKKMSDEVAGETLGEQYKGYVFKISGGNDKQGFPMKEGVLAQGRVRLLLGKGQSCFRERRSGTKRRKSVRGCLVGPDLSVLALVIVKKVCCFCCRLLTYSNSHTLILQQ